MGLAAGYHSAHCSCHNAFFDFVRNPPDRQFNRHPRPLQSSAGASTPPATGTLPRIPPGFQKKHVYAIVGYDPATDVVEIWNPHGQTFHPRSPPGLTNGYETTHGRFKLPLTDAYSFYTSFTFELDTPAPKAPKAATTQAAR